MAEVKDVKNYFFLRTMPKVFVWKKGPYTAEDIEKANQGRKTSLSKYVEKHLSDKGRIMAKLDFPLIRPAILAAVQDHAKENDLKTQFQVEKPGKD